MTKKEIMTIIYEEVARAKEMFPSWPVESFDNGRIVIAAIIAEEAGEVVKAALNMRPGDPHTTTREEYRQEIVQTAAMCIRALERM
jgi:phosphoribosyl-ATP pyrophosphohydrolase